MNVHDSIQYSIIQFIQKRILPLCVGIMCKIRFNYLEERERESEVEVSDGPLI